MTGKEAFRRRVAQGPILADGAMGTELQRRANLPIDTCFEKLNLTHPDLVRQVHLDYIEAGAEIVETNTYGANAVRLERHGLDGSAREINHKAVALAREAQQLTGQRVWIAGAVGPLGRPLEPVGSITHERARRVFQEQAEALVEAGVDVLMLETFTSVLEIEQAVLAAKRAADVPVIAQLTFAQEGHTPAGETAEDVVQTLTRLEVDVIGANCSVGSEPMMRVVEAMTPVSALPVSALPNAGFPEHVDGRVVYFSSPAYMAGFLPQMLDAGAAIIGGCCGTTPEHIAAMRDSLRQYRRSDAGDGTGGGRPRRRSAGAASEPKPPPEPTRLAQKIRNGEFVVTVEVHPPRGFDVNPTLARLRRLLGRVNIDAFNATDIPLAQSRMSALAMSTLLQTRLGVEAIMHVATRYRNLVALHSDLLGAHALGVRNIVVFMGDTPSIGDYPQAVSFSDVTSSGLIRLIRRANDGVDLSGNPVGQPTSFFVGGALNLEARDMDRELASLERKINAGADFIFSQSVFDPEALERMRQRLGGLPAPFLLSVLPLRSHRHAEFLHNEVPGMVVRGWARERMRRAGNNGAQAGVELAQELITAVQDHIAGVYFVPSFGRYEVVAEVMDGLPLLEHMSVRGR